MFNLIPSDANDPQGLMRRKEPTNKQTICIQLIMYSNVDQPFISPFCANGCRIELFSNFAFIVFCCFLVALNIDVGI